MASINFTASPVCGDFMRDQTFGRLIAGPVGSGKTTACIFELFRRACEQAPSPLDGLRYTRFAIVRSTLKQLRDTVLKDVLTQLKGITSYKVSENTVFIEIGDVRSEWLLIPLDDPEDQRRLLSMQLTGAWLSESIEMEVALIPALSGRCGRYPSPQHGGATWFGLVADTNFPSEGSEWHEFMELKTPPDWRIFKQPGGLDPYAENLNWLTQTSETLKLPLDHPDRLAQGRTYYERLSRSNGIDWIKRYVHAEYGDDPSGSAIYKDSFNMRVHAVSDLQMVGNSPLIIGQDFGRDPWAVICQLDPMGVLRVLEEVEAEDRGLDIHIKQGLRPALMQERFMGRAFAVIGDPAGKARSSIYEETTFDTMARMGFHAFPAPTNDIEPRIRAVEAFLTTMSGGQPGFLIDKDRCPKLTRALNGGYRYGKTRQGNRKPLPEKDEYSHVMDALQYAALATHGGMVGMIKQRLYRRDTTARTPPPAAAWT